ncbi:MAG: PilZ domain-containing protein, partial [Anaeromyxobacteraceae bacterium]
MGARKVAKKGLKSKTEATSAEAADRRRFVRVPVMLRVDYAAGDRGTFAYSSNLSTGGIHLRGSTKLEVGQQVTLELHLKTEPQPVKLKSIVRDVGGGSPGAGLEFLPGQDKPLGAVRRFIEDEIIAKLEVSLAASLTNSSNVGTLAGYYVETGRIDEAVDLYWRALQVTPAALPLYEGLGQLLMARVRAEGQDDPALLADVEAHLAAGLSVGKSPTLLAMQKEAAELRKAVEQRKRELAQREEEKRKREEKEREEKLRAALAREAQAQAEKEVAAHRRELDARLQEAEKAIADERKALKHERAALATAGEELKEQQGKLDRQQQKLGQGLAKLEEERQALRSDGEAREAKLAEAAAEAAAEADRL